jgi:hypothetical protein
MKDKIEKLENKPSNINNINNINNGIINKKPVFNFLKNLVKKI